MFEWIVGIVAMAVIFAVLMWFPRALEPPPKRATTLDPKRPRRRRKPRKDSIA